MKITKDINENIFREYDIRGIADTDLTDDVVYTIGLSYGNYIKNNSDTVIIGHDNRLSSKRISNALTQGLIDASVKVIDLGLVTTPMLYFAKKYKKIYTGIMITASHNPKEYNGLKFSFSKIGNAYGKLISDFKTYTLRQNFQVQEKKGSLENFDIRKKYVENIKKSIDLGPRKIKVAFDLGNGTGSIIIKDILDQFDIDYELLYAESDGNFPNHIADPAVSSNMIDLGNLVKEKGYDLGIGIDGDADRVGIVLENGEYITADILMLMIYQYIRKDMKNPKALYDVKCSRTLIDGLKKIDLKPVMNRTGNSYCNLEMQKGNFDFGGEYSGHLFFRDKYQGFDDGIYAGMRIVEMMSNKKCKISDLLKNNNKYYATEETKIKVTEETKFDIVEKVKQYAIDKKYEFEDIDGIRVEFKDSWALVRASNTGPNLTVRYEASTKERLKEIEKEFNDKIYSIIK